MMINEKEKNYLFKKMLGRSRYSKVNSSIQFVNRNFSRFNKYESKKDSLQELINSLKMTNKKLFDEFN